MKEAEVTPIIVDKNAVVEEPNKRIRGKIIRLYEEGGYGFISSFDKPFTRIYFHWQALDPKVNFLELKKGDFLTFECVEYIDKNTNENKGWRAIKIERG